MSVVRFIADLHFGHKNMAIKRGFSTVEEHDQHIIKCWNKVVHKRDLTFILGDITMESIKPYPLIDELAGRKIVVMGNHDKHKHVRELLKYVESVGAMIRYKGIFLSHCPVHPMELDYRVSRNIHGHLHENNVGDEKYYCVSCEQVDYTPKTLNELGIER